MKIVHVNTSDINGGAAIAVHRLHLSMLKQGIDSKMLVLAKNSDELNIEVASLTKEEKFIYSNIRKLLNRIPLLKYKNREKIIFSPANIGIDVSKHKLIQEADIIYLHWIVGGFLSLNSLKKIAKLNKKIKWVLHDSWAFTGGCHVRYGCERYQQNCGKCPMLGSKKDNDLSRKVFKQKQELFKLFKDLTIVTPSKWLGSCVSKSSLLKEFPLEIIPNVLDENIFKSLNKEFCKEVLNLDKEKKNILFGAMAATSTPYKGWKYLKKALILLDKENPMLKEKVELLVFGASHGNDIEKLPFKTKFLGRVYDESTLALIYNSANVFVGPSLEEAFGQTFNESVNCGTPAIAFEKTGVEDIITHKENGYLAKYKDVKDLVEGIKWGLERKFVEEK